MLMSGKCTWFDSGYRRLKKSTGLYIVTEGKLLKMYRWFITTRYHIADNNVFIFNSDGALINYQKLKSVIALLGPLSK